MTHGGETFLRGASCDKVTWTRLATTAEVGDTFLSVRTANLAHDTAWRKGDTLLITSTAGPKTAREQTELVTIAAVGPGSDEVTLAAPLKFEHAGCEEGGDDEAVPGLPCVIAAEVAPLSRNIRVRGEESCKAKELCGHTMFAHTDTGTVCGVEFSNLGQKIMKGRYPLHLHMAARRMFAPEH